jgi:hypothetical protein
MQTRRFGPWALVLTLALATTPAAPVWAAPPTPSPAAPRVTAAPPKQLSAAEWRTDLHFLASELERRHKNLFHTVSREAFAAAVAGLDARIPTLKRHEIIVGMMRIVAMVRDGHTRLDPLKDEAFAFHTLPVKLYLFDDGLHVFAATPAHKDLLGARVTAIGGVPVHEALRRVGEISAVDNAWGKQFYASSYLAMPEILNALKLSQRADAAVLTLSKGKRTWTVTLPAAGLAPDWPPDTDISLSTPDGWLDARGGAARPMWLQAPLDYQRMIDLPEQKALYVQLNMVTNVKDRTLSQFGKEVLARAKETDPRSIILDLRLDRGGNGDLRLGFVKSLIKAEDEDTRLFVLVGRATFSASQFLLDDLDRFSDAVFVGEPASSKSNSYGDGYRITLPNSGLRPSASIYWWQVDQRPREFNPIDVAAPLAFEAYAAGRDPALEAALSYQPKPTLEAQLLAVADAGGDVRQTFETWRAEVANRYVDIERQLVIAGQSLYRAKHPEQAVAITQIAIEQYPHSVDPPAVLAFLGEWTGNRELALRGAKRALELDPDNRQMRALVERVNGTGKAD